MARATVSVTLGGNLGSGRFNTSGGASKTLTVAVAAVQAKIDLAAADVTIAGNGTALGLVNDITTALALVDTAANGDLVLDINLATITSENAFKAAVQQAVQSFKSSGLVS